MQRTDMTRLGTSINTAERVATPTNIHQQQYFPAFTSPTYFIHHVVCLTTGPWPLPKWVRSSASSFNFQDLLVSLRSSSGYLRLLPSLPVLPAIPCFRKQFLCKMWQIQLAFVLLHKGCSSSLTLCNTSFLIWCIHLISIFLQHHISKLSRSFWSTFRSVHFSAP
jgi:hypothetical protein